VDAGAETVAVVVRLTICTGEIPGVAVENPIWKLDSDKLEGLPEIMALTRSNWVTKSPFERDGVGYIRPIFCNVEMSASGRFCLKVIRV